MPVLMPIAIESLPKSGPTVRSSTTFNGAGKAPARSNNASSLASATVNEPLISPRPPAITLRITGAVMTLSSRTIAKERSILFLVISPNKRAPSLSNTKLTTG